MGKRVKKKGRSVQKDKKVSAHSPKIAPQQSEQATAPSVDAVEGGVAVSVKEKERKLCVHLDKGFNLNSLSEKFASLDPLKCEDCREGVADRKGGKGRGKHGKKKGSADSKSSESKAIWVCVECGHFACGGVGLPTTPQCHAIRHARQTRHPLVMQWENPHLRWCFPCNTLIPVEITAENGEKKDVFLEVVKLIKSRSSGRSTGDVEDVWFGGGSVTGEIKGEGSILGSIERKGGYAVRGLVNLGNTCFFNSVMQNLLAMDKLLDFFLNQDASFGPLTISLKKLYSEAKQEGGLKSVINPRSLFGAICSKAPMFRGYQQQDSHELLRCLLDGLSSEELFARKQANASKEHMTSSKHEATFVESLFGGQISSTVSCIECGHSSTVYEPCLDLSLPVPTKKPPTKKALPVSKSKKPKLPPKRGGKFRPKFHKDADSVPKESSTTPSTCSQSPCQTQLAVPHAENAIAPSDDAAVSESVDLATVADKSDLISAVPDAQNVQMAGGTAEQTTVSIDDSTWMDYLGEETISDEQYFALQTEDVPTTLHSENIVPIDGLMETNQVCPTDGGQTLKPESSVNPWEEEVPVQINSSEVLLLPYKEESFAEGDIVKGEAEASSVVGYGLEEEVDFDGLGDLFNEPEVSTAPVFGPSLPNGTSEAGFTAANSSESDPDEVDNSDSPVSVESCLAHFTKSEILSNDNAWECENCSKILQRQRLEAKKKAKMASKTMVGGDETQIQSPPSLGNENLCSIEVRDLRDGDGKTDTFLKFSGASLVSNNEKDDFSNQNCIKSEIGQNYELNSIVSRGEEHNGENIAALEEQSHSSATYKSCSEGSLSCPAVNSSSSDEPSGTSYVTAHDQMGESQFSGDSGAEENGEENEDEEGSSRKVKVKRDATKRVLVDKAPPILTIHLKRFSQDARGHLSKLNGYVNFGEILDLRPYIDPRCVEREKYIYRLLGVVEHSGTMRGGHYVAYVRGEERSKGKTDKSNADCVWYHASDAYVRQVSIDEVLHCEAYILFYEKIDI